MSQTLRRAVRLAFPVLLGLPAAAMAQSGVTLYGVIDTALTYQTHSNPAGDAQVGLQQGGEGFLSGSRFGLKGVEDLGGDAHLVGGSVRLERGAEIAGPAWIAGGDVQLLGRLGGRTKIYAGSVAIDGIVDGDLQITAKNIELRPGAQVAGAVRYTSPNELRMAEGAKVAGTIERQPTRSRDHSPRASSSFGIVLWLLTWFTNRGIRAKKTGFRDVDHLEG